MLSETATTPTPSRKRSEILLLLAYLLFLYTTWTLSRLFLIPSLKNALGSPSNAFVEPTLKILLWVVPVFLYLKYVNKSDVLAYLRLKQHVGRGILWGLFGSLLPLASLWSAVFIHRQMIHLNLGLDNWLNVVLLVGILEEIPFRGLFFQKMQELLGFWPAALLSSLLFVLIHLPIWLAAGDMTPDRMLSSALYIFILGFLWCYLLYLSRSLWSCIIMHSVNDLVSSLL